MAHEIERNKAFFVSEPAWHERGEVLAEAPTIQAAWSIAYPHSLIECALDAIVLDADGNRLAVEPFPSHKAIIRDDGKHIGCVTKSWQLEQPIDVMNFFQPFLDSGMVKLEAGGSLRGGKRMWALGKIQGSDTDILPGDAVQAYLLAATSFDGSMRKIIKFCATRVVCANTLAVARSEKGPTEFLIRHTKNMGERTIDAQQALLASLDAHKKSVEAYQALARKPMAESAMKVYVRDVFAPDVTEEDCSPQMNTKVNLVIDLLDSQRGLDLVPAARGTAWQAYNAVSEYITHHASRTADTRLANQWFDAKTNALNTRALDMALAA